MRVVVRAQGWGNSSLNRESGKKQVEPKNSIIPNRWLSIWGKGENGDNTS